MFRPGPPEGRRAACGAMSVPGQQGHSSEAGAGGSEPEGGAGLRVLPQGSQPAGDSHPARWSRGTWRRPSEAFQREDPFTPRSWSGPQNEPPRTEQMGSTLYLYTPAQGTWGPLEGKRAPSSVLPDICDPSKTGDCVAVCPLTFHKALGAHHASPRPRGHEPTVSL